MVSEEQEAEVVLDNWMERICPECGQEISLHWNDVRQNCDLEGKLVIRCPVCNKGKITYQAEPPLTKEEVTKRALEVENA